MVIIGLAALHPAQPPGPFSSAPLYLGRNDGFHRVLSFAMLVQTLYKYFIDGAAVGFTTVIALQVMLGGMVLSALGVMTPTWR